MSVLRDEFRDPHKVITIENHVFGRSNDQTIDLQEFEPPRNPTLAREFCERWIGLGSAQINVRDDPESQIGSEWNDPVSETGIPGLKGNGIVAREERVVRVAVP
jgi:hypothetical protein